MVVSGRRNSGDRIPSENYRWQFFRPAWSFLIQPPVHHFFAVAKVLSGHPTATRQASSWVGVVGGYSRPLLNDVPEYIQFQKFEFGVYLELSIIIILKVPRHHSKPFSTSSQASCAGLSLSTLFGKQVKGRGRVPCSLSMANKNKFIFGPNQKVF